MPWKQGGRIAVGGVIASRTDIASGCRTKLAQIAEVVLGHLLETFVVGEVSKQLDWLDAPVARGHWRTHDGDEADLVLEREDGKVVALEVKASSRVRSGELRSLARLRRKLASQFLGGIVLYTGQRAYTHDTSVYVVLLARLWQTATTA